MRRWWLILGLVALAGCKTVPEKPYPAVPLFISREPTPGKVTLRPALLAAATPVPRPPPYPVALLTQPAPAHYLDASETSSLPAPAAAPPPRPAIVMQHADDYRWLVGILDRHYEGKYFLRYCPATQPDRWGGKVRLQDPRLANFRDGDVVRVEGILAPLMDPPPPGECPRYHLQRIQLAR